MCQETPSAFSLKKKMSLHSLDPKGCRQVPTKPLKVLAFNVPGPPLCTTLA